MSSMAKEKKRKAKPRLRFHMASALDFPPQALFGVSIIEIRDFSEMSVRECSGISAYNETEIVINVKKQKVRVEGTGLSLRRISENEIAVDGRIRTINLID